MIETTTAIAGMVGAGMIGACFGFVLAGVLASGKRAEFDDATDWEQEVHDARTRADLFDSNARLADALDAKSVRIERALECVTPGANATVKRMAAILAGDA